MMPIWHSRLLSRELKLHPRRPEESLLHLEFHLGRPEDPLL